MSLAYIQLQQVYQYKTSLATHAYWRGTPKRVQKLPHQFEVKGAGCLSNGSQQQEQETQCGRRGRASEAARARLLRGSLIKKPSRNQQPPARSAHYKNLRTELQHVVNVFLRVFDILDTRVLARQAFKTGKAKRAAGNVMTHPSWQLRTCASLEGQLQSRWGCFVPATMYSELEQLQWPVINLESWKESQYALDG